MKTHSAFTILEVLIAVTIIGIMSGLLAISSSNATDKARALKIVSDMQNVKTACVLYYSENGKYPSKVSDLNEYLDTSVSYEGTPFSLESAGEGDTGALFVKYDGSASKGNLEANSGVATRLFKMKDDIPLYKDTTLSQDNSGTYDKGNVVYILVKK
ncbi:MAG: prepilin-type N-terminal cleavage/methylation domain-containing protein [Synergistaceae bacterium]|nr:prepilin-type N-terminal cleavage/methylation domain-containing protein [Synergistaceae bacterium]